MLDLLPYDNSWMAHTQMKPLFLQGSVLLAERPENFGVKAACLRPAVFVPQIFRRRFTLACVSEIPRPCVMGQYPTIAHDQYDSAQTFGR